MDFPEKTEVLTNYEEQKPKGVDQIIVFYHNKFCSCIIIFLTIIYILLIWLPFLFFLFFCLCPYKRVVIIDSIKQILIIYSKAFIPCCKLAPKTFVLNSIKKVIIFITWKNDPKIGFNKLYFINCDLVSTNDMRENLFENVEYNENKLNEFLAFFRKYFETEFKPAEDDNNPIEEINTHVPDENIMIKPSANEGAATPVFA